MIKRSNDKDAKSIWWLTTKVNGMWRVLSNYREEGAAPVYTNKIREECTISLSVFQLTLKEDHERDRICLILLIFPVIFCTKKGLVAGKKEKRERRMVKKERKNRKKKKERRRKRKSVRCSWKERVKEREKRAKEENGVRYGINTAVIGPVLLCFSLSRFWWSEKGRKKIRWLVNVREWVSPLLAQPPPFFLYYGNECTWQPFPFPLSLDGEWMVITRLRPRNMRI